MDAIVPADDQTCLPREFLGHVLPFTQRLGFCGDLATSLAERLLENILNHPGIHFARLVVKGFSP